MAETRKLAAILALDIVGYSRLARADEDRTLARIRALRSDLIDPTIAVHHGRVVKRTGDGAIVEFRSVVDALRCAIEVQNAMVERNSGVHEESRILLRMGVHVGDVVQEDDGDLMGDGVNIAARLEGVAKPGAICLSEDAYRQVKQRLDVAVADLGEQKLKNIAEPVRAFSVEVGHPAPGPREKAHAARFPALAVLAVVSLTLAAMGIASWWWASNRAATAASASPQAPTLLIMPLVNATGDSKFDATARRISDKLIGYLSRSIFWKTVESVGADKSADADYVLDGLLEGGGPGLRISVHLIDSRFGAQRWATTISPLLEDASSAKAEDEVAGQAAGALRYPFYNAQVQRLEKVGQSHSAYGCMLKGYLNNPAEAARLRQCEEEAVAREPTNVFAWLGLALVLQEQFYYGWGLPPEDSSAEKRAILRDKIYEAHMRAKSLAPEDSEIQSGMVFGNYARCDLDRMRVEAAKVTLLNPYDPYHLGWNGAALAWAGDWDEGVEMAEKGIKLAGAGAYPIWSWASATRHFNRGEYQAAYEDFQRSYMENFWPSHFALTISLVYLGRLDEAKTQLQRTLALNPAFSVREANGYYRNACFPESYREKVVFALRKIGAPE